MKYQLGKTAIKISSQGLGCMSMSEFYGTKLDDDDAINLIKTAFLKGVNLFDTADVYGFGDNEILLGRAASSLVEDGAKRSDFVVATKCGILRDRDDVTKRGTDNSYSYVKSSCMASLGRLGKDVGYIDLYYIHRLANNGAQISEAMKAMAELLSEGKIKSVGLSEASPEFIQKANDALLEYSQGKHQIAAVQTEYSLLTRTVEQNGVLDICRKLGITFIAYSPLSRALLTGNVDTNQLSKDDFRRQLPRFQGDNLEFNNKIVSEVSKLAQEKNCGISQIALAWVMAQPGVIPIPGTTKIKNLLNNLDAEKVTITDKDLAYLDSLEQARGTRYTEVAMKAYGLDSELGQCKQNKKANPRSRL